MKRVTLKQIKSGAEDHSDWLITFYPLGYLSHYVSWFFANFLPFTPNQISFIWEIIALIGIGVMAVGGYWWLLAGILIYHLAILLDYVDGQIARATDTTSMAGAYLDTVFSWINRSLLMLALGAGLYHSSGVIIYFYLGLSTCLFLFFDNLAKLKVYETFYGKGKPRLLIEYTKDMKMAGKKVPDGRMRRVRALLMDMMRPFSPFSFLFFTILLNASQYYLIMMAALVPILFLKNFFSIYKRVSSLPNAK